MSAMSDTRMRREAHSPGLDTSRRRASRRPRVVQIIPSPPDTSVHQVSHDGQRQSHADLHGFAVGDRLPPHGEQERDTRASAHYCARGVLHRLPRLYAGRLQLRLEVGDQGLHCRRHIGAPAPGINAVIPSTIVASFWSATAISGSRALHGVLDRRDLVRPTDGPTSNAGPLLPADDRD